MDNPIHSEKYKRLEDLAERTKLFMRDCERVISEANKSVKGLADVLLTRNLMSKGYFDDACINLMTKDLQYNIINAFETEFFGQTDFIGIKDDDIPPSIVKMRKLFYPLKWSQISFENFFKEIELE